MTRETWDAFITTMEKDPNTTVLDLRKEEKVMTLKDNVPGWKIEKGKNKEFYIVWWYGFHGSPSSKWVPEPGVYITIRHGWKVEDIEAFKKLEVHESHIILGATLPQKVEVMRIK
tara:strand:- start:1364 stop:1708 length:345 start_codon:yes stop_codon:yes gene_type:complete